MELELVCVACVHALGLAYGVWRVMSYECFGRAGDERMNG